MAINQLAPMGLLQSSLGNGASPTYQPSIYKIKKGYASNIGIGDLVKTLTGGNQGYVGIATLNESAILGVFTGITSNPASPGIAGAQGDGYYDLSIQQYVYGLNGAYQSTANPISDIGAKVVDDPNAIFRVQMSGGPWTESMRGQNINFLAATNGVPNASGISTLAVDATTINTTNTLPFRLVGLSGIPGSGQDPGNTNPWVLVRLNTPEYASSTGI